MVKGARQSFGLVLLPLPKTWISVKIFEWTSQSDCKTCVTPITNTHFIQSFQVTLPSITFYRKWWMVNTVDVGLFVKKHTQMLAILIWKQNAQKRTKNPPKPCTQCQHCHLSLPPFRAALVPLWAMAPRFVQEAFSLVFQFPPQVRILVSPGSSQPLLSSAVPRSSSLRSRVQSQEIYQHFALYTAEGDTHTVSAVKSFANKRNPRDLTSATMGNSCVFVESDYPVGNSTNTHPKQACPFR